MKEYTDFLGSQPPYDALDAEDLRALARRIEVEYFAAGAVIVQADEPALDHLLVVRTGAVEVIDRGRVIDQLGPGDTFGHISVLTGLPPALSVVAVEDTLCLRLPDPRAVVKDPGRLRFAHFGAMISRERLTRGNVLDRTVSSATALMRPVVWARHGDTVADTARRIGEAGHSCALLRRAGRLGIATDRDFREKVATGEISPQAPVEQIMSFPAVTISEEFSQAAAFSRMIDKGVHHLVVVDGRGSAVGVLRTVDFAAAEIRTPLLIRSQIEQATTVARLREAGQLLKPTLVELAANGLPALHIGNLLAAVVDALLRKLIELHAPGDGVPAPSWIVLGSMARREPLPASDVDTAIVWRDVGSDQPREDIIRRAEALLGDMESCGLRRCVNGANAVNPLFCRSDGEWSRAVTGWLSDPAAPQALLLSSIVMDSRPLTEVVLGKTVTDALVRHPRAVEFLHAFLKESTAVKPPTGFVRDFVVDHSGQHRGQLDLKRGGLLPVASIGRWIAAVTGDSRGSTLDRLTRGHQEGLLTRDETDTLEAAFEQVYELLLKREIEAISTRTAPTTYLAPRELDILTRRHLRETFRAIAAVQSAVENSWMTRVRR
ncbi:cyclic nucleotide-binding domain-containing protein [Amycolatopsis acidicola]|uniref:Cyclic nucleotide-binding domain-containing protein n=1 Tax=Amycolatopsis acidicola TaxID=2596893 RepID=A0A5N0VCA4_9PSEU|nr:putative nucleotidyltransferase substrate binding domain-containing protein [Amycolatopsis acidicola]KAA9164017.1 cyclic nucleotide-binding domain-containing protein [Amycolatopsis acidicola]